MSLDKQTVGILAGLAAGALWGTAFVMPQVFPGITPVDLTLGRYVFFGLAGAALLKPALRDLLALPGKARFQLFCLSASGFWLYTIFFFWAVHELGGVVTTLVIGLLPATIPLMAKKNLLHDKTYGAGLLLGVLGLAVLQLPALRAGGFAGKVSWSGIACLLASLALWTWYGVKSTAFRQRHPHVPATRLASLMGLMSLAAMAVIACFTTDVAGLRHHADFGVFLLWSAITGIGAGWTATLLWNTSVARCPPAISGPLIVSETVFGLLYTFLYQQRWPTGVEAAAILLSMTGVFIAVRSELKAG